MRLADTGESIRHFYLPVEIKMNVPEPAKWEPKDMKLYGDFELKFIGLNNTRVYSLDPIKLQKNEGILLDGAVSMHLTPHLKALKKKINRSGPKRYAKQKE